MASKKDIDSAVGPAAKIRRSWDTTGGTISEP